MLNLETSFFSNLAEAEKEKLYILEDWDLSSVELFMSTEARPHMRYPLDYVKSLSREFKKFYALLILRPGVFMIGSRSLNHFLIFIAFEQQNTYRKFEKDILGPNALRPVFGHEEIMLDDIYDNTVNELKNIYGYGLNNRFWPEKLSEANPSFLQEEMTGTSWTIVAAPKSLENLSR